MNAERDAEALAFATEIFLDAFRGFADGRDDDDLVFIDGQLRELGEQLGAAVDFPEVEPMTAGEFRRRYRSAKESLAQGIDPNEDEIEVSVLEMRVRRAKKRGDLLGDAYKRHRDRADAAEQERDALKAALADLLNNMNEHGTPNPTASYYASVDWGRRLLAAAAPTQPEGGSE